MVFGTLKQFFVKTGTTQEKPISLTFIARYRGLKQKTITHGYFFCWPVLSNKQLYPSKPDASLLSPLAPYVCPLTARWTTLKMMGGVEHPYLKPLVHASLIPSFPLTVYSTFIQINHSPQALPLHTAPMQQHGLLTCM